MKFSTIQWQDGIIENLKQSILNHTIGHALLFTGETKTCVQLAHCVADAVLCDRQTGESCGVCPSCKKCIAGSHPDKIIVEKQKASRTAFGVDDVREMISAMYVKPFLGGKKIYIFDDASHLTPAAQNALLKILESPPPYGMILLCAQKEEDLLPTVLSRLKKYRLAIPTGQQVGEYLAAKYPEQKELALFCGRFCEGNASGAEELLRAGGDYDKRKRLCLFLLRMCGSEKSAIFDFAGYLESRKEEFEKNAAYFFSILRDVLYLKNGAASQLINSDLLAELKLLVQKMPVSGIIRITNRLSRLLEVLKGYASFPLSVTDFLLYTWEDLHD